MSSRKRFLISHGAWLAFVSFTACSATPEEEMKGPPPVVGVGRKPNNAQSAPVSGTSAQTSNATGKGTQVGTMMMTSAATAPAADGGAQRDAGESDTDAGPVPAGSGGMSGSISMAAGSGGSSGSMAAGSGGRAGSAGRAGQGGTAGQAPSEACVDQLCFTVFDCWLLSVEDCGYTECENFICK